MAKYEVDGQVYEFPDDISDGEALQIITNQSSPQSPPQPTYTPVPKDAKIDPDTLQFDKDFLTASKVMYEKANPQAKWQGSDKELSDWGLDQIYWFDNNFALGTVMDAARLRSADKDELAAFMHVWDTYEKLQMSWGGAWRTTKAMALDPSNYLTISALIPGLNVATGPAAAGAVAGRTITKEGLKAMLKAAVRPAVVAGVEAGALTAASDAAKQSVLVTAGRQEEIDMGRVATAGAIGVGAGVVIGGAAKVGIDAMAARKAAQEGADAAANQVAKNAPQPSTGSAEASTALTPDQLAAKVETPNVEAPAPKAEAPVGAEAAPAAPVAQVAGRTTAEDVIAAVKAVAPDFTEAGAARLTAQQITDTARQASEVLQQIGITTVDDVIPTIRSMNFSEDQLSILKRTAQSAFEETGKLAKSLNDDLAKATGEAKDAIQRQIDDLEKVRDELGKLDVGLSSTSGSDLASRVGGMFVGDNRGLSRNSILREQGIDPALATAEQKAAAQTEFNKRIDDFIERARATEEARVLDQEIAQAAESGDFAKVTQKLSEKDTVLNKLAEEEAKKAGVFSDFYKTFNEKVLNKVNEYIISTVFTPATVIVNFLPALLKTAYKPFMNYIVKGPLDQAAFREMTATYSTMYAFSGSAIKAARAAFKYERSLLTGATDKLLEGGPAIAGLKGRVIRTFPRLLSASDEFFAQINYRAYVVGEATSNAVIKGTEDGLKGKALDDFVKTQVEKAVSNAYSAKDETTNIVAFLRNKGMDLGYTGERLNQWMKTEFEKNADLFKQGINESGRNYADDLLFKREFSGSNSASKLALGYERFVNNNPIMRLAGQLFFRTPVRVFEEGIRLTPGLNLISPNFVADLAGKNGTMRQVRAQGEAMASYALGASVLALYANGRITGGGPSDYKQRRGLENSKQYEPYTIVFKDGSTFSFRNLDPFATPLKIMVNALDRYQMLQYRKRQGEYVDNEEKEAMAWVGVGVGSVIQAVKDANLAAGVDQIITFAEALGDPEANEKKFTKFFGQKAQLAVPGLVTKVQQQTEPMLSDPATIEQFLRARINPSDAKVPKRYDSLGSVVEITNPIAALTGINITSKEQRDSVVEPKRQEVLRELSNIEIATSSSFQAPYKNSTLGDLDLRTVMTQDGKETLYDRWNRYVSETTIVDDLHSTLVQNKDLSYGTKTNDGLKIEVARDIISMYRDAAFMWLMSEETKIEQRYIQQMLNKVEAKTGSKDVPLTVFQTR
jgi:hypothetical protein